MQCLSDNVTFYCPFKLRHIRIELRMFGLGALKANFGFTSLCKDTVFSNLTLHDPWQNTKFLTFIIFTCEMLFQVLYDLWKNIKKFSLYLIS
jgi:hypothetical protein